jgi:hypothetical protein
MEPIKTNFNDSSYQNKCQMRYFLFTLEFSCIFSLLKKNWKLNKIKFDIKINFFDNQKVQSPVNK